LWKAPIGVFLAKYFPQVVEKASFSEYLKAIATGDYDTFETMGAHIREPIHFYCRCAYEWRGASADYIWINEAAEITGKDWGDDEWQC